MYYLINFESARTCPIVVYPLITREEAIQSIGPFIDRMEYASLARDLLGESILKDKMYFRVGGTGWYASIEGPLDPTDIFGVPLDTYHTQELYEARGIPRDQLREEIFHT